jgi:hypothetical protein
MEALHRPHECYRYFHIKKNNNNCMFGLLIFDLKGSGGTNSDTEAGAQQIFIEQICLPSTVFRRDSVLLLVLAS